MNEKRCQNIRIGIVNVLRTATNSNFQLFSFEQQNRICFLLNFFMHRISRYVGGAEVQSSHVFEVLLVGMEIVKKSAFVVDLCHYIGDLV